MKTIISATALALMLAAGAAFAQTDPAKSPDPNAPDKQPAITEDADMMKPFYTDDSMMTLRPMEEFTTAWKGMSAENQAAAKEQCKNPESEKLKDFCGMAGKM